MTRPCSLSRSNSSAHHRLIRTALLPEFGGMGIEARHASVLWSQVVFSNNRAAEKKRTLRLH
jgi:hypothetical protein